MFVIFADRGDNGLRETSAGKRSRRGGHLRKRPEEEEEAENGENRPNGPNRLARN